MTLENLFTALNYSVLPAWLLLAIAPSWGVTKLLVHSFLYPVLLGGIYSTLLIAALFFGQSSSDGGFSTIAGVSALFSHPVGVLTGWTHYLVFDLFVGAWISRDAIQKDINYWLVIPCLFFTLMFGPVGLLLYFLLRLGAGHRSLMFKDEK